MISPRSRNKHRPNRELTAGWREGIDRSFDPCETPKTILQDSKLVLNLEDQFGDDKKKMVHFGHLLHDSLLYLEVICKDRRGVIDQITNLARKHQSNIIGCLGDLMRPRVPNFATNKNLTSGGCELDDWFMQLGRYRLHQLTLMLTGKLSNLRNLWNSLDSIKDLDVYQDRVGPYRLQHITASGPDRIGVLQDLANTLNDYEANIQSLASRVHFDWKETRATVELLIEMPLRRESQSDVLMSAMSNALGSKWKLKKVSMGPNVTK